jgi:hypothetical protein
MRTRPLAQATPQANASSSPNAQHRARGRFPRAGDHAPEYALPSPSWLAYSRSDRSMINECAVQQQRYVVDIRDTPASAEEHFESPGDFLGPEAVMDEG